MTRTLSRVAAFTGLLIASVAFAQQNPNALPHPRLTTVFPVGGQVGTTVEVTVSGTDLDDADTLVFSHPGIRGEVVAPPETPDPKADPKKAAPPKRKKDKAITSVKCKITVAADVPVGQYDVRVGNQWGLSNPRAFCVGKLPETTELEPNDDALAIETPPAGVVGGAGMMPPKNAPRALRVEYGATVNGVLDKPTDVDYLVFAGKANQRVLVSCLASSIDSRSRPLVEVYDPSGRRLGMSRNYDGTDALADVALPADGDYFVRVCEFAYQRGGADYFYRLTVGTGPWIDAVFPPAVNPGKPTQVTVFGRNLPGGQVVNGMTIDGRPVESLAVTVMPPTDPAAATSFQFRGHISPTVGLQDAFEYRLTGPSGVSNAVPVFLTDAKVALEKEAGNDKPEAAEPIPTPCEVAGRIDKRYDRDFYSFAAKKDEVLYITAFGEQVGATADLFLRVRDGKGKDLAGELDDDPEPLHPVGFYSRTGDPPAFKFTAPADGTYTVLVGSLDANVNFGPRCPYRLRVTPANPDFRAVVMAESRGMPCTLLALPGGEVAFDVLVQRTDGFTDPVTVTAENLPPGVTAKPAIIGSRTKWGSLVLSADAAAKPATVPVTVKCTATINGKQVVRTARPASITWGNPQPQNNNNAPLIARVDQQLLVAVRADVKAHFRLTADLAAAKVKTKNKEGKEVEEKLPSPIVLKPGDKVTLPVKVTWLDKEARANPVNVKAEATQANMNSAPLSANNNQPLAIPKEKNDGTFPFDVRSNAVPGTYSLVLKGDTQVAFLRDPEQKDKKANAVVGAVAEPIEITVLPASLAKVKVDGPPNGQIKLGAAGELTVKVERQGEYDGEYKVKVVLPKDTKGVTVKDAVIPAGKSEVKVPVAVAADAKVGGVQNVVVEVTGTVHKKYDYTADDKLNLNIVK